MTDRAAFAEHVGKVDGLFAEAELEGTRYVIGSEASGAEFKLSLLDVLRQRLAERELSFDQTDRTVSVIVNVEIVNLFLLFPHSALLNESPVGATTLSKSAPLSKPARLSLATTARVSM